VVELASWQTPAAVAGTTYKIAVDNVGFVPLTICTISLGCGMYSM